MHASLASLPQIWNQADREKFAAARQASGAAPKVLFRADYVGARSCVTFHDTSTGEIKPVNLSTITDLGTLVLGHELWRRDTRSPFVTCMEDTSHAYNWASHAQYSWLPASQVTMLQIDPAALDQNKLVKSSCLFEAFGVTEELIENRIARKGQRERTQAPERWAKEWLYLGATPPGAIKMSWSVAGKSHLDARLSC